MRNSNVIKYSCLIAAFYMGSTNVYAQKAPKAKKDTAREAHIDEVVVIGYGTSKKSDLTGSIATVSGNDLKKVPVANVAEALTGKIAGVSVTTTEGSPDAEVNIKVRGGTSITQDSSPLVIVDGFPVNSLNDISPSDIENISVLKDASSTAIYGARGANGVILVTTKTGKSGKVNVTFNSFTGFKFLANTIDVLSPYDYAKWQYEFANLVGTTAAMDEFTQYFGSWNDIQAYKSYNGINWQKEIYGRTGTVFNNEIGIRGGSDKTSYNLSFSRYDDKGIMILSDYVRDNLSANLKTKVSDKVDLNFTFRYSNTKIGGGGNNEQKEISSTDSRLKYSVMYSPINIPGLVTEDTDDADDNYLINPYTAARDNDREQERRTYNVSGNINWKITKNLQFKSDLGMDYYRNSDYRYYGRSTYYVDNIPLADYQGMPALVFGTKEDKRFRNSNTLTYDFKSILGDNHKAKLLIGEEMYVLKSTALANTVHGFPNSFGFEDTMNLTTQGKYAVVNNYKYADDKLLSFFGRLNYDFKNRYLFTATFRADGSSKFIGNNRWGFFPSAAAAWKMNEESFLKNVSWINMMKLRLSYGQAGNNNIPVGQTSQLFLSSSSTWINDVSSYFAPDIYMANPDLKWETTVTQNLGFDFELFNGRINGTVEAYKNLTKDLLIAFPVTGGYSYQYRNLGENENKGIEATLNLNAIRKQDYGLNFGFNIALNRNKVNSLGNVMNNFGMNTNWASTSIGNDFLIEVGQPLGQIYGYVSDGRYEVSDFNYSGGTYTLKDGVVSNSTVVGTVRPGTMKLKDINGDGKVDTNDQTVIGNTLPKATGGFTLNANVKNFDFSAAFNFSIGNDVYNANKIEYSTAAISPDGQFRNLSTVMADGTRWTNIDPNTGAVVTDPDALAALNANTTLWSPYMSKYVLTDWAVEDGSFLRLSTVTLGYSLPAEWISKIGANKFRLYVTANNVFVWTKYSGLDPEVSTRRATPLTPGVDYSPYPKSRMYLFGINLGF
ncbi:MAG: TonB-dependent receptor [Bergeyella sp.]